jgi:hypothetical protein
MRSADIRCSQHRDDGGMELWVINDTLHEVTDTLTPEMVSVGWC